MGHVDAGWTLPTENNIYGSGTTFADTYTVANAWYCQHLWQHYMYTMDREYLRTRAFPVMKSAVDYWLRKLVKASDGTYECPDEWSPEHGPTENATAHSQQLVWDLFNSTRKAIKVLGDDMVSRTFRDSLAGCFARLDDGCHTRSILLTDRLICVNGNTLHSLTTRAGSVWTSTGRTAISPT